MENTLENKAKLFSQYTKHRLDDNYFNAIMRGVIQEGKTEKDWKVKTQHLSIPLEEICLPLKSLLSITDEDALQVAKFEFPTTPGFQNVEDGRLCTVHEDVQSELSQPSVDYLRLKGYAVPFLDLSVKSQISYGWVKLSEVC